MRSVFEVAEFTPPYDSFKFPGQHQDEQILFATRTALVVLVWRVVAIVGVLSVLALAGAYGLQWLYRRTVFLVTSKRLTQFVFTTPWTHFQLSLSLDKVVDAATTTHTYFQKLFAIGDLFARSAAGAQGDFLVENIEATRDLHNWLTKLLHQWVSAEKKNEALVNFQPFTIRRVGRSR